MMGDCDTCPRSETCEYFEVGEICFEVSDRKDNWFAEMEEAEKRKEYEEWVESLGKVENND